MTFAAYLDLVNRVGIKRAEIDIWLLEHEEKLPPKRKQVMTEIGDLLEEADHALFHMQRRLEVLNSELDVRELELRQSRRGMKRLMETML